MVTTFLRQTPNQPSINPKEPKKKKNQRYNSDSSLDKAEPLVLDASLTGKRRPMALNRQDYPVLDTTGIRADLEGQHQGSSVHKS